MQPLTVDQNAPRRSPDPDRLERHAPQAPLGTDDSAIRGIDVVEVVRELTRPWERAKGTTRPNYLNADVRDLRGTSPRSITVSECPVCDGTTARPTFEVCGLPYRVVTCSGCQLGRLHPLPTIEEIGRFYPAEYYGTPGAKFEPVTETLVRLVGTLHVRSLSRSLPAGSRVLDVGCGRGVLLSALADRGFEVHGMDVSATAVEGADPRAQIRVAGCLTEVGYPAGTFQQVILWHVLEHLRNPREVLEEVHRILAPGGRVIIAVPNFSSVQARWSGPDWFHLDLPRHLYHFPVEGLRSLMSRTGFRVSREQHFSLRQNPFGWVQSALNRWSGLPRNALYNLLYHRGAGHGQPAGPHVRRALKAGYFASMPVALGLSLLMAMLRSGASVCLVGKRTEAVGVRSTSGPA
jgi:2-polyprenyl-3-methyl-5-hydroxy-6-metoxy-1,4-benzoquinol methylase